MASIYVVTQVITYVVPANTNEEAEDEARRIAKMRRDDNTGQFRAIKIQVNAGV